MTVYSFLAGSSKGGNANTSYPLNTSLRIRSSASAYLSRTPASASNRTTWTWSGWVKRGTLSLRQVLFACWAANNDNQRLFIEFGNNYVDELSITAYSVVFRGTTQLFRDPSAWYHIIVAIDTTQATASNRIKIYVNGVQVTSFATSNDPALNASLGINQASVHDIGQSTAGSFYFDGYLAEVNFIDGQALTPSAFGAYDIVTGVWQPSKYTGTYGTNGFYLPFSNTTSTTTLGYDFSGNGNNWTTNNISLTAGSTYDAMTDVPTLTSNTSSNYCVMNPLNYAGTVTPSNGNLTVTAAADNGQVAGTIGMNTGKWYYEHTITAVGGENSVGIGSSLISNNSGFVGFGATQYGYNNNGNKYNNASSTAYGATFTTGDVIGVAYDAGAGSLTFYKNGTSQGVAFTGLTGTMFPLASVRSTGGQNISNLNFGQQPFVYTPPTGFSALNTANLPIPTITNGALYNAATIYTGNGSSQSIVNSQSNGGNNALGNTFEPDLVWIKDRTTNNYHVLFNSIVGGTNYLSSNSTQVETGAFGHITFNSNGFTVSSGGTGINNVGYNGDNYVAWQWNAGSGTSGSNTNGSITSTVSVNQVAGFSIVTWTGTGVTGATVGHGLNAVPSFIITKVRSTTNDWPIYHISLGNTGGMYLDLTNAFASSAGFWNNTSPTSTVFTVVSGNSNASGQTYVGYCWTPIAGYSSFGSYTGNGSTDGTFVFTNFRPRFILIKRTDTTSNWYIWDTSRNTYNVIGEELYPNLSNAGSTATDLDVVSNGFKLRSTAADLNASGGSYIYAAFAENPFRNALAR